jgi:hypothetical protein
MRELLIGVCGASESGSDLPLIGGAWQLVFNSPLTILLAQTIDLFSKASHNRQYSLSSASAQHSTTEGVSEQQSHKARPDIADITLSSPKWRNQGHHVSSPTTRPTQSPCRRATRVPMPRSSSPPSSPTSCRCQKRNTAKARRGLPAPRMHHSQTAA